MGDRKIHIPKATDVHDVVRDERRGKTFGHPAAMPENAGDELRGLLREASAAIEAKHRAMGGAPGSAVGVVTPGPGFGFYQLYTEGGIYWRKDLGAIELYGTVYLRYSAMGGPDGSFLGYPVVDQTTDLDGIGKIGRFEHGSIHWSPRTDAFEVHGAIDDHWRSLGGTQGWLGYPVSDEYDDGQGGRRSDFENGRISWTPDKGPRSEPQWLMYTYSPITFGTGIALGGNARLILYSNGVTQFQGHLHDGGLASYDTLVAAAVYYSDHKAIVFTHTGQANGQLSHGGPDDNWDDWKTSADVVTLWANLKEGTTSRTVNRADGYLVFAKIIEFLADVWNAFDGSAGENQDQSSVDPYYGSVEEDSLPPSALRLN